MFSWWFGLAVARVLAVSIPLVPHSEFRVSTVTVGGTPRGVAVNPATHEVYVVVDSFAGGAMDVLDHTGTLVERFAPLRLAPPQPSYSYAVVIDPRRHRAYVDNQETYAGTVTSIDRESGELVETGVGDSLGDLAIHVETDRIYVGHGLGIHSGSGLTNITVLDGVDRSTHSIPTGTSPLALAVDEPHSRLYVANQGDTVQASNTVTVVDTVSEETRTVTVGTTPFAIAVDATRDRAWVVNASVPLLLEAIEAGRGFSMRSLPLGVWGAPAAVAVNPATDVVFVALQSAPWLLAVQGETLEVRRVAIGQSASRLAIDSIHDRIYALQPGPLYGTTGVLTVIDGETLASKTVTLGRAPYELAVDPDLATAYVSNSGDGTITIVETVCFRCPRAIPVRGHVGAPTAVAIAVPDSAADDGRPTAKRRARSRP